MLVKPQDVTPRCTCTVDLISKVMRPYLFRVTVQGEPPHECQRLYVVSAESDDSAALKGLELFVKEFSRPLPGVATIAPRAKLA